MPMTVKEFRQLKNFMMRGAASDSDAEALTAFRMASTLLYKHGQTWATALDRCITIIDGFETPSGTRASPRDPRGDARGPGAPIHPDEDWEQLFNDARAGATGTFRRTVDDIYHRWQEQNWLSPAQKSVIRDAAERYNQRTR